VLDLENASNKLNARPAGDRFLPKPGEEAVTLTAWENRFEVLELDGRSGSDCAALLRAETGVRRYMTCEAIATKTVDVDLNEGGLRRFPSTWRRFLPNPVPSWACTHQLVCIFSSPHPPNSNRRRRDLQRREGPIPLDLELILPPTGAPNSSHKRLEKVTDRRKRCARPRREQEWFLGWDSNYGRIG